MELNRARGRDRAGSGRRESDATRGAMTTTREDATRTTRWWRWMWMDGFVFVDASEAPRMDARARACVNARASAMDDDRPRARAFAFDRRRWCAREDDEGETRRRTGEEK